MSALRKSAQPFADLMRMSKQVQTYFKMRNLLLPQYFLRFWERTVPSENNATCYLTILIIKYMAMEAGVDNPHKLQEFVKAVAFGDSILPEQQSTAFSFVPPSPSLGSAADSTGAGAAPAPGSATPTTNLTASSVDRAADRLEKHAILQTIYFIILFHPFRKSYPPLKNSINQWQKQLMQRKDKTAYEFSDTVSWAVIHGITGDHIATLLEQITNFSSTDDKFPSTPKYGIQTIIEMYLRGSLVYPRACRVIVETITKLLSAPGCNEKRGLAGFHLLRCYLVVAGACLDRALLYQVTAAVRKRLKHWPMPFSEELSRLLRLLTFEKHNPGFCMRESITEQIPEILDPTAAAESNFFARTVYVLIDQASPQANTFLQLLKLHEAQDVSLHQLRISILGNIFEGVLDTSSDVIGLQYLPCNAAAHYYCRVLEIMEDARNLDEEDAIVFLTTALELVKNHIVNSISSTEVKAVPSSHPELPPYVFEAVLLRTECERPEAELKPHLCRFPYRSSCEALSQVFKRHPCGTKEAPNNIRLAVAGSDRTWHNVLTSIVALQAMRDQYFEGVSLQMYLFPLESSNFLNWFGMQDGWFWRHVALPFRTFKDFLPTITPAKDPSSEPPRSPKRSSADGSDDIGSVNNIMFRSKSVTFSQQQLLNPGGSFILPGGRSPSRVLTDSHMSNDSATKEEPLPAASTSNRSNVLSPSFVLYCALQNYIRDARHTLRLHVYQCSLWTEDDKHSDQPRMAIPFFQRLEIGLNVAVLSHQKLYRLTEMSADDIIKSKDFKFAPIPLNTRLSVMNPYGNPRGLPQGTRSIQSLVMSSMPVEGDKLPGDPLKQWLELRTVELETRKSKKKSRELVRSHHASHVDLEVEDRKRKFDIMLDGQLYGQFTKVTVSPLFSCRQEWVCMSLATFFPAQED
mmetsp:Transcript_52410/g.131753  ORF Transcript_52410/g.131753 Transcript_52410/m.131753 type:complete len:915 (-) Transcript_52410:263-3007(-)